ncbi:helix-turn-helix domain-containing protein [Mucilaginibacter mallensis]|uniref:helix-turn-helix domain-containing protein n=1 Tax=Mucilaginibacter mallensis TaxID=652787 RepID=UPI0012F8EA42|nr:AraC family transcriptional regulator [Mucilaginibacter mallensis]
MKKRRAFRIPDKLQKKYKRVSEGQIRVHFEEAYLQTGNEKFLGELIEYIKQNISNPNLSVETTSREMKMCRVSLYKKLKMLTGKSPVEFIQTIRLQKAAHLLENTEMKINQVASEVGFEAPQYFAKLFKREYDILPSAYVLFIRKAKTQVILSTMGWPAPKIAGFSKKNMNNKLQTKF